MDKGKAIEQGTVENKNRHQGEEKNEQTKKKKQKREN